MLEILIVMESKTQSDPTPVVADVLQKPANASRLL
jgi:hypothetical protein